MCILFSGNVHRRLKYKTTYLYQAKCLFNDIFFKKLKKQGREIAQYVEQTFSTCFICITNCVKFTKNKMSAVFNKSKNVYYGNF